MIGTSIGTPPKLAGGYTMVTPAGEGVAVTLTPVGPPTLKVAVASLALPLVSVYRKVNCLLLPWSTQ